MRPICKTLATLLFAYSICSLAQQPAALAPGKSTQSTPDSGIRLHATSRLVVVDVVVTDSHGNAIHGLKREDFKVKEDSAAQEIRGFEPVTPATPPPSIATSMPPLPPNVYTNFQQAPAAQPAINLLLLDALNTPVADQIYVRQEMLKYLKTMPPGAHIAIFTLSSQLRILQGFTTDSSALIKALNSPAASARNSPLLENPFDQTLSDQFPQGGEGLVRFESDNSTLRVDLRIKATMDALTAISAYLSGVPGRKNLIWFSAAFPLQLLPNSNLENGGFSVSRDYGPEIRAVTDSLTLGQIAIYPVDARGLFTSPIYSAENRGGQYAGRNSSGRFFSDSSAFAQNLASEHQAMDQIAQGTGGRAFYNTNGIQQAMGSAIENGSNYYRISYTPTNKNMDGRFRKIKISLAHSGYILSYRRGYLADDLESAKYAPRISTTPMQTAMLPAAPTSSQIVFKARVLPADELPQPLKEPANVLPKDSVVKGTSRKYVIDYVAAARNMTFTATPDGLHHGSIDVAAMAFDATGKTVASTNGHLNADLNPASYADISASGMPLRLALYLPVGNLFLRLGIEDAVTGRIGSIEIPLHVTPAKPAKTTNPASPSPVAQPSVSPPSPPGPRQNPAPAQSLPPPAPSL